MQIDIWSDVNCPWCAIGRAHLMKALAARSDDDEPVTVRWRSFELDPSMPKRLEGDHATRLADKYGMARDEAVKRLEEMTARGAALGVRFAFDRVQSGNSFDAHRLLQLAHTHGLQDALKGRLFEASFGEGVPLGDPDALAGLAIGVGLPAEEVREVLAGDRFADAVRADEQAAAQLGIRGVPFFVFDQKYAVSGAQPAEVLDQVMGEVVAARG